MYVTSYSLFCTRSVLENFSIILSQDIRFLLGRFGCFFHLINDRLRREAADNVCINLIIQKLPFWGRNSLC